MELRQYQKKDLYDVINLFYETVQAISGTDYSKEEIYAWSQGRERLLKHGTFFETLYTVVAVESNQIIGYGNVSDEGYLDHLYVHKDYQRQGVATAICNELERYILALGILHITVHASITARPFFEYRGYSVVRQQTVIRKRVALKNYEMGKWLSRNEKELLYAFDIKVSEKYPCSSPPHITFSKEGIITKVVTAASQVRLQLREQAKWQVWAPSLYQSCMNPNLCEIRCLAVEVIKPEVWRLNTRYGSCVIELSQVKIEVSPWEASIHKTDCRHCENCGRCGW